MLVGTAARYATPGPRDAATDVALDAVEPSTELVCEPYDELNPACRSDPRACTEGHADCKCPSPPDVENPACWAVMPCPTVPDRRVRACLSAFPPCPHNPVPDNPNCPPMVVLGRVINAVTHDGTAIVTIGIGTKQGIAKHWSATLLRGDSEEPLPGGEITIVRINATRTLGEVGLPLDDVRANSRVRFSAR